MKDRYRLITKKYLVCLLSLFFIFSLTGYGINDNKDSALINENKTETESEKEDDTI